MAEANVPSGRRKPRKLILCFDGTGNKFRGDDSDSNILKIFRVLDRTASDQYHYYQPGIGTYVVSSSLSHTSTRARLRSWYMKAKDSAVGSSFDQHVVGGYRFLMRFYCPGDDIFIFGFSRGAYIARFLAEMLDYVGLLSHGNEEMVAFAWKAFSQWQCRRTNTSPEGLAKKHEMYEFMKGFRETFSRPVKRIRFLGLFDTVNSVPRFETAWMERSKFPYTARSSAKVIRHAVSIDERRAKFRQDLMYQSEMGHDKKRSPAGQKMHDIHDKYRRKSGMPATDNGSSTQAQAEDRGRRRETLAVPEADPAPYRALSRSTRSRSRQTRESAVDGVPHDGMSEISHTPPPSSFTEEDPDESEDETEQDIDEVWFAGGHADVGGGWEIIPGTKSASHVPLVWMVREAMRAGLAFDEDKMVAMGCLEVLEDPPPQQEAPTSEMALAPPAPGIAIKDAALGQPGDHEEHQDEQDRQQEQSQEHASGMVIVPDITIRSPSQSTPTMLSPALPHAIGPKGELSPDFLAIENASGPAPAAAPSNTSSFKDMMHRAHVARIHDSLCLDCGLGFLSVVSWKLMEYMPFRRMDLQPDGSWKPIRWPLPCGEVRDVPDNVRVHGSVIRRMRMDESYRPGNLIVGGGGRGCRVAPKEYGMGEWECVADEGDPIGEVWMKKKK